MNSLWWLALITVLLPLWWHRKKQLPLRAQPLASARFLPRSAPQQLRAWRWADVLLLLVRCLLLACAVAWLADPVWPWRASSVIVAAGSDPAWVERAVKAAGMDEAARLTLPADAALAWIDTHERELKADAQLLVLGTVPMPARLPQFGHVVHVRSPATSTPAPLARVAIVSERPQAWRRLLETFQGPLRIVLEAQPGPQTDLIVWDLPTPPAPALRAPLWWVANETAFPALAKAASIDGIRYADSVHGRLWANAHWPPATPQAARDLLASWRTLHGGAQPYPLPDTDFAAAAAVPAAAAPASAALRPFLLLALVILFGIERSVVHVRRV